MMTIPEIIYIKIRPQVYNKNHKNYPEDCVYIGRGSDYGNPFTIGKDVLEKK